ncbi:MAG: hypothetical protein K6F94_10145 [Bacteroidaceae bacterium]|nr:hypothetical protein [Bacteroidaceae bacterium]
MKSFEIGSIVSRAWDLSVKHWPIFVLIVLIEECFSSFGVNYDSSILTGIGQNPDPQVMAEALMESVTVSPLLIVSVLISLYLGYVMARMLRSAIETGKPYENMVDAFKIDLNHFAIYFAVDVCFGLIVGFGLCLCLIPGIFFAVRWLFAPYIAATEKVGFVEAFSRSWQATKGNFWMLFLLGIVSIFIELSGLLFCCVGVLFTSVIASFALMLAYLELKDNIPTYNTCG